VDRLAIRSGGRYGSGDTRWPTIFDPNGVSCSMNKNARDVTYIASRIV
jgi:hypothetical protein